MKKLYLALALAPLGLLEGRALFAMKPAKEFSQFNALFSDLAIRYLTGEAITKTQLDTTLGELAQTPIDWDRVARFAIGNKDLILQRAEKVSAETNPTRAQVLNALAGLKIIKLVGERISSSDVMKVDGLIWLLEARRSKPAAMA